MKYCIVSIIVLFVFLGCKKESFETVIPKITDEKVEVSATTATFIWTVDWPGKLVSVVEVSESEDMSNSQCYGSEIETENHSFTVIVKDLKVDTKYYYRFWVWNKYYEDKKFKMEQGCFTIGNVPIVITEEVTDVTGQSAIIKGKVVDDGGYDVSERGVCWSTSPGPTVSNSHKNSGSGMGHFTVSISCLSYKTTYYVRAYAINEMGTVYGEELSFVAREIIAPVIGRYYEVKTITHYSGSIHYSIYDNGGATITSHGLCWSTVHNPTTNSNCVNYGILEGSSYVGVMDNLPSNQTYYVRAYATNSEGTSYGEEVSFTTHNSSSTMPVGAVNGHFTINEVGSKVWFSQGNLQYQASSHKWRFAEHQYDFVGGSTTWHGDFGNVYENGIKSSNNDISSTYSGWIDLFGWGTSGWNCGNQCYQPWHHEYDDYAYGPQNRSNLTGWCVNSDWGVYNTIGEEVNNSGIWRTLTRDEWNYVINLRNTSSGIRYAKAQIDNVDGLLLLPDDWSISYFTLNETNNVSSSCSSNVITIDQWNMIEQYGVVFLPIAGSRTGIGYYREGGYYWSASTVFEFEGPSNGAYYLSFANQGVGVNDSFVRADGYGVRLVCDIE